MIRFRKIVPDPDPPPGYRFVLHMPGMPAFDFNDASGIFVKHPRTGIIMHKYYPDLRDTQIIHVHSAADLLVIKRDFDPAVLKRSVITYGNNWLAFNSFFITPSYGGDKYENEELADMVIRLMHRGKRSVACALEVTSEKALAWHWGHELLFKNIRIRDTTSNQQRVVVPKAILDYKLMIEEPVNLKAFFDRPGKVLLSGMATLQMGERPAENTYYICFHIRNLNMLSDAAHLSPGTTRPDAWRINRGYPGTDRVPAP